MNVYVEKFRLPIYFIQFAWIYFLMIAIAKDKIFLFSIYN